MTVQQSDAIGVTHYRTVLRLTLIPLFFMNVILLTAVLDGQARIYGAPQPSTLAIWIVGAAFLGLLIVPGFFVASRFRHERGEHGVVVSLTAWAIELIGVTIVLSFVAGPPVLADDSWLNVVIGLGMVGIVTTLITGLVSEIVGKVLDWRDSESVRLFTR